MPLTNESYQPVSFQQVTITGGFWKEKLEMILKHTLPTCIAQCENTQRINNFKRAAGLLGGPFEGNYYDDSDVYKVLEGIAYALQYQKEPWLEQKADEWISYIEQAQQPDGYLVCYFILGTNNEQRWTDMERHEDYCLGHMIEAAVAYFNATGKRAFLDVAIRFTDHFAAIVGEGRKPWVTGHQEIELALVKLFDATGNPAYLSLADWLISQRGHGLGKGGGIWEKDDWGPRYTQDYTPAEEQDEITGHAVRAVYYFAGMTDIAARLNKPDYWAALNRLWQRMVNRNMYLTGGIGSSKENEGFSRDYDLPNDTAYCETCAAAGMAMWAIRMGAVIGQSHFNDIIEKELYNGILAGVALSGTKFFYVNPLSSSGNHHRVEWFGCSCCPTQISRFIPSVGGYAYATTSNSLFINQYMHSIMQTSWNNNTLHCTVHTDYPCNGRVYIQTHAQTPAEYLLCLRIPDWCSTASVTINGQPVSPVFMENGYIKLLRCWQKDDSIELEMDMPAQIVTAHPLVPQNINKLAITRGPLVYCAEQADGDYSTFRLSGDTQLTVQYQPKLLGGVCTVTALNPSGSCTLIPYYTWDNRTPGPMDVWLPT